MCNQNNCCCCGFQQPIQKPQEYGCKQPKQDFSCCKPVEQKKYNCYLTKCVTEPFYGINEKKDHCDR